MRRSDERNLQLLIPFLLIRSNAWNRWAAQKSAFADQLLAPDFADRVCAASISARTGPNTLCLKILLENALFEPYLLDVLKSAQQPSLRAVAAQVLLLGHVRLFDWYEWRWTGGWNGKLRRFACSTTRDLAFDYDLGDVVPSAAKDPSPFVRRFACEFLIDHRSKLAKYQAIYEILKDDRHPFCVSRRSFLTAN